MNEYEEHQANEAVITNDEIETNMQQSNKNIPMYSKSILHGCLQLIDSECHMNIDTLPENNAIISNNPCDEKVDKPCACAENHETTSLSEDMIAFATLRRVIIIPFS